MKALAAAGVGVEYMYAFISRDEGRACVILRFTQEDTDKAVAGPAGRKHRDSRRRPNLFHVNGKAPCIQQGAFAA